MAVFLIGSVATVIRSFYERYVPGLWIGLFSTVGWAMIFGWLVIEEFNARIRRRRRSKA